MRKSYKKKKLILRFMLINFYVKRVVDLIHIMTRSSHLHNRNGYFIIFSFIQAESLRKCGYYKIERFVFGWSF